MFLLISTSVRSERRGEDPFLLELFLQVRDVALELVGAFLGQGLPELRADADAARRIDPVQAVGDVPQDRPRLVVLGRRVGQVVDVVHGRQLMEVLRSAHHHVQVQVDDAVGVHQRDQDGGVIVPVALAVLQDGLDHERHLLRSDRAGDPAHDQLRDLVWGGLTLQLDAENPVRVVAEPREPRELGELVVHLLREGDVVGHVPHARRVEDVVVSVQAHRLVVSSNLAEDDGEDLPNPALVHRVLRCVELDYYRLKPFLRHAGRGSIAQKVRIVNRYGIFNTENTANSCGVFGMF